MRDPARIDRILSQLRELWHAAPDLRLGQIVVIAARPDEPSPKVFYIEDDEMEAQLAEFHKQIIAQQS